MNGKYSKVMAWFNNLMSREEFSSSVQSVTEGKGLDSFKVKSNTKGKYFSRRGNTTSLFKSCCPIFIFQQQQFTQPFYCPKFDFILNPNFSINNELSLTSFNKENVSEAH